MRTPKIKPEYSQVKPRKVTPHKKQSWRLPSTSLVAATTLALTPLLWARYEHRWFQAELAAKTTELTNSTASLADTRGELNSLIASNEAGRAELDSVKSLHFYRVIRFADFVLHDPAMAERVLDEAAGFAEKYKLDLTPVRDRIADLPKARVLAAGTKVSVLSMNHTGSVSTVDIAVVDSSNTPVDELARVDFIVSHKGKPIHLVRVEPTMVASGNHRVSFLFDCSSSFALELPDAKLAGKALVTALANPWKFRVVRFASDVQTVSPWSFDPEIHTTAIDSLVADGATSLLAAMEADAREQARFDGTHSTVILTDGKDSHGSANIEQILKLYQQSSTRVHIIALDRGDIDEPLLRRIANETKGSFQKLGSTQELRTGFKALAERMKRPVYRLTILGPLDRDSLSVRLANDALATPIAQPQLTSSRNPR